MKAKKFLVIGLALVLAVGLVGCGEKDVDNDNENNQVVSGDVSGDVSGENNPGEEQNNGENENTDGDNTLNVMSAIAENATIVVNAPFSDVIPAEQAYGYIGLSEEEYNANVVDSAFYESMIMPATESYCLVKVNDNADVATLKQTIFDNANPRKWVCTSAERVVVIDSDRYILLAMGRVDSVDSMVEQFTAYFGGNVGEMLDRAVMDPELPADTNPENPELPGGGIVIPMPM